MIDRSRPTSFLILAACVSTATPYYAHAQQVATRMEDRLVAAGFEVKPANTPERQDMLSRLPPRKFVRRVQGDDVAYIYADPKSCDGLFIGTQDAYGAFCRQEQAERLADEEQAYADARWDWGAWGPWSRPWSRFRFGYGW